MNKKVFLQLFLLSTIIVISYIFFKIYFTQKDNLNFVKDSIDETITNNESNIIYDIEYYTEDERGNSYIVKSKKGEFNDSDSSTILMINVEATLNSQNSDPIKISSDNALYNKVDYDTNFYTNVVAEFSDHIITSDNLDLFFKKNLATISNNIVYKNLNTKLEADKIEIDLITKNSKIFMDDKSKKVNIVKLK
jgi:lipopolysaccharide export system protein LptA